MTPNLNNVLDRATSQQNRKRPVLVTRKPTGKPPWPLILLAGAEKAGKSYSAALASASPHIGRTFWIGAGEDDPDEYGAIPGARFEIVPHDGTYQGIYQAVYAAVSEPADDPAKPNMIVLDSGSRFWDMLSEEAQELANARANRNRSAGNYIEEAPISMDLWNRATKRWNAIMGLLRHNQGPVIITARLETVTIMDDNGRPTTGRQQKVKGQKGLPFDVGVVVQMPKRGEVYLTGVRSLRIDVAAEEKKQIKNFTLDGLWKDMGVLEAGGTSPRIHADVSGEASAQQDTDWLRKFNEAKGDVAKLEALVQEAEAAGLPPEFPLFGAVENEIATIATAAE